MAVFTSAESIYATHGMNAMNSRFTIMDFSSLSSDFDENVFGKHAGSKEESLEEGSDSDSTSEGSCLGAMTVDGQDHYLRLGDTPRRRSALRLSRIIARQQLLRKLAQGMRLGLLTIFK